MSEKRPATFDAARATYLDLGASRVAVLIPAGVTGGAVSILEYVGSPGFAGPPLHVHPAYDEVFYVLAGTASFRLADEAVLARPGEGVYVVGAIPHTFANAGSDELRMAIAVTPGGMEAYFEDLSRLLANGTPDPSDVVKLWDRYGLEPIVTAPA